MGIRNREFKHFSLTMLAMWGTILIVLVLISVFVNPEAYNYIGIAIFLCFLSFMFALITGDFRD